MSEQEISRFFQPVSRKRGREEGANRVTEAKNPKSGSRHDDTTSSKVELASETNCKLEESLSSCVPEHDSTEKSDKAECSTSDVAENPTKESEHPTGDKENPFARFVHQETPSGAAPELPARSTRKPLSWQITSSSTQNSKQSDRAPKPKKTTTPAEWMRMRDVSPEEQERVVQKWHSMVDTSAPLETRRFQLLVATRLHARCQEPSVRKAMQALREALPEFTVEVLAKADPEVMAHYISNIQFFNIKAKHIVKAAQEIKHLFNGMVPEDEHSLLKITGVGKVFADLLAFVNTRAMHERRQEEN